MNAINENTDFCETDCISETVCKDSEKMSGLQIAFSMILFISTIAGIWQASSIALSIAASLQ